MGSRRADVLVLLAIVVVGSGLVLGAVQRVREAAAVMKCHNNLKQISLSTAHYASVYNRLPPLVDQGDGAPTGRSLPSVFTNLIPFLEATPMVFRREQSAERYHAHSSVVLSYGDKLGGTFEVGGGVANNPWPYLFCSADATADRMRDVQMTLPDGATGFYATGSYAANGLMPWGAAGFPDERFSNTILFAERPQVCRDAAGEVTYNLWGLGFYSPHMPAFAALAPDEPPGLASTGQVAPFLPLPDASAPDRDAQIRVRIGRQSAEPIVPDFAMPVQRVRRGQPCDPRLPASPHLKGMQAALANGSVRVIAYDTSPWVFWSLCAPAGQ